MVNQRVLTFRGDLDIADEASIELDLDRIYDFGTHAFAILDLTGVRYLDTTFLNALMRVRSRLAKEKPNVRICLVAPPDSVVRLLFGITKLNTVFQIFNDIPAARRSEFSVLPGFQTSG